MGVGVVVAGRSGGAASLVFTAGVSAGTAAGGVRPPGLAVIGRGGAADAGEVRREDDQCRRHGKELAAGVRHRPGIVVVAWMAGESDRDRPTPREGCT